MAIAGQGSRRWYWLSFSGDQGPLGAALIDLDIPDGADEAARCQLAIEESWLLGVNPGGEVLVIELPEWIEPPPGFLVRRLLPVDLPGMKRLLM